jgi:hypothetical protein
MKSRLILAMVVVLVSVWGSVYAQQRMTDQQKQEAKAKRDAFKEKLNLTEEQKPKFEEINRNQAEALSALKNSDASRLEKFRKYRDLKSEKDKKMKELLTKEQFKIYEDYQEELKDDFMNNRRKQ